MERRARLALFAVLFAIVAAGALLIALTDRPPDQVTDEAGRSGAGVKPEPGRVPRHRRASGARGEDRGAGEARPTVAVIEASRAGRGEARPVVERFLRAYLDYEVGDLDGGVRDALRASATSGFAHELLGAPVRLPLGVKRTARARVVRVEIYLAPAAPEGTATALLERSGERHRAAFLLRRGPGGWRVAGLP